MEKRTVDKLQTDTLVRSVQLDRAGLNKETRTITVRFSTETPVKRWFGQEILSHDAGAAKLERFNNGAAVLCEHDTDQRCGITESASITPQKNGEAVIRFARTPLGDQVMGEVEDGTLRWVSVGYVVNRFEVDEDEEEYRAIEWEPLEVSFVGIPADPNAKVLRSENGKHESMIMKRTLLLDAVAETQGNQSAALKLKEDFSREMDEAREIFTLATQYQPTHPEVVEVANKALKDKTPIREFQRLLMGIVSKPSAERVEIIPNQQRTIGARSIGGRFVQSPEYAAALKRGKVGRGNHVIVELPDMHSFRADPELMKRATFGLATSDISGSTDIGGTGGIGIDIRPEFNLLGQQPVAIADLFSQGSTGGDQVRIVRELSFTNSAARVAEAGNKPEGQLDIGVVNFTVEKTAVFLNVTEEMLADQSQASSFVNSRLSYMVQIQEDDYLLNGTGASQITGILNTTGIQTIAAGVSPIDSLLRAKGYVEGANNAGFATPDAYVMNPLDWLSVRLAKDVNGQYLLGGPGYVPYGSSSYSNVGRLWELPVVTSTKLAQGTVLVGAFRMGAQIFRRMGVTIRTTDSHASNFIANIMTIVAESRFALAVYVPNKFCTVTAFPSSI